MRRKSKTIITEDTNDFWISYSDLMASILIIFIFLFISKLFDMQVIYDAYTQKVEEQKESETQYNDPEGATDGITTTREEITSKLQESFNESNLEIIIDENTGDIRLKDGVLFKSGESNLIPKGKDFLNEFIPKYFNTLLEDPSIKDEISEIIIEGHTDDVGSYIYNLKLSQDRAYSVTEYILNNSYNTNRKNQLEDILTVNGKSFSILIRNEDGTVDRDKSRRVEFKFSLKEEEDNLTTMKKLERGSDEQ